MVILSEYSAFLKSIGDVANAKRMLTRFVEGVERFRTEAFDQSISRLNSFGFLTSSGSESQSLLAGYRDLALLHAEDGELEAALRVSELARDRALGDLFSEKEWRRRPMPVRDRDRLNAHNVRVQSLDERIAVATDVLERIRLEAERVLAVGERGKFERALRDRLGTPETRARPPSLDELRAQIGRGTALVSVVHSGKVWWALAITRDRPASFIRFDDPGLGPCASAWLGRLRGDPVRAWPTTSGDLVLDDIRPATAIGPYLSVAQLGERLGRNFLDPLVRPLGNVRHIVFIGDDELAALPVHALPLAGGFAIDRFDVSYAPSLATFSRWQGAQGRVRHARDLLAIGAVETASMEPPASDDPVLLGIGYAAGHPLAFARKEIDAIYELFPAERAEAWTGSRATKAALREASRSGALAQFAFVHFATHAWSVRDEPDRAGIALAGSAGELPTQMALTAAELSGLEMNSDLIVLSACDSGAGRFEHGRGQLGLAYAALAAGNRAALLTLWPIADDTTSRFMSSLYRRLRRGDSPESAVAGTQREFRAAGDPQLADPSAWAPFVVYGGY